MVVMEDMKIVGVATEEAVNGVRWRQFIYCGNHERAQLKEEEKRERRRKRRRRLTKSFSVFSECSLKSKFSFAVDLLLF